ncbi:MAG TPA: GNAT family N-acetyltransferase [Phycisphaerales bacterium]|nr:GNAT family N-acetyltransferase [Phycisphaerales bacterium]
MPPPSQLDVRIRPVTRADLDFLFQMQQDPEANRLSCVRPRTREQFDAAWERSLTNPRAVPRAIVLRHADGTEELVGAISVFSMDGLDAVGYAVARPHWGRGIVTRALMQLLQEVPTRPLHARAAASNTASVRALLRCGFTLVETKFSPESPDGRYLACDESSFILRA